jgi:hypothetical protein
MLTKPEHALRSSFDTLKGLIWLPRSPVTIETAYSSLSNESGFETEVKEMDA